MATIIEMPKLSDTMTTGTVVTWHKKAGDAVTNGDIIAEIETDKATMELENFDDGILLELFAQEGDEVEIGKPLAVVGKEGEEIPSVDQSNSPENNEPKQNSTVVEDNHSHDADSPKTSRLIDETTSENGSLNIRILVSPLARKIAKDQKIDLSTIVGSGPNGRIVRKDLLGSETPQITSYVKATNTDSTKEDQKKPISKMRSVIARRLLESKTTIPHFYLQKEVDARPLRLARESINRKLAHMGEPSGDSVFKVSINDLVLKACAAAISQVPEINSSWQEDHILIHGEISLAFGVAVEDGLVTPVIRNADHMSLLEVSNTAKALIAKARTKKITPEEMTGSTFTVTNLGMYDLDFFSGIINPPNAAILSVGAAKKKAVVSEDGSVVAGERMILGLSCDHRLVDGAVGATFLHSLGQAIECPASLLV